METTTRSAPRRPILGLVRWLALLALLQIIAGLWWFLPYRPDREWLAPLPLTGTTLSDSGRTLLTFHNPPTPAGQKVTYASAMAWDMDTGRLRATLPEFAANGNQTGIVHWFSADDRRLAFSSGSDGKRSLRLWDLAADRELWALPNCEATVEELLFDGDTLRLSDQTLLSLGTGRRFACTDELANRFKNGWEVAGGNSRRSLLVRDPVLLTTEEDCSTYSVAVWDWASQSFVLPSRTVKRPPGLSYGVAGLLHLDAACSRLALPQGRTVEVWDLERPGPVVTIAEPEQFQIPGPFSPDGTFLIVYQARKPGWGQVPADRVAVWDVTTMSPRPLIGDLGIWGSISADGRWALAPELGRRVELTSLRQEATTCRFPPTTPSCYHGPGFTEDGRYLSGVVEDDPAALDRLLGWLVGRRPPQASLRVVDFEATYRLPASLPVEPTIPPGYNWRVRVISSSQASRVVVVRADGRIQTWQMPLRRGVMVDYGLPALFVLLALTLGRQVYRQFRPNGRTRAGRASN
jgi:WD40 repeat protein